MPARRLVALVSTAGLGTAVAAAAVFAGSGGPGTPDRPSPVALTAFEDCSALRGYFRSHGRDLVGPYGLSGRYPFGGATETLGAEPRAAPAPDGGATGGRSPASGSAEDSSAGSGTGTNVQVAGVDEADVAKRVGDLLLAVNPDGKGGLQVLRTGDGVVTLLARLTTPGWTPTQLLVDGHTAVLIGTPGTGGVVRPQRSGTAPGLVGVPRQRPRTRLLQVDLSDPTHPRAVRTLDMDGTQAGARLVDGVLRIAVDAGPGDLGLVTPQGSDPGARQQALTTNQARVAASSVEDWLPSYRLRDGAAPVTSTGATAPTGGRTGQLVGCSAMEAPADFAGLDTLTLLGFDLRSTDGIGTWRAGGVVADGTTLYATTDHTYLATRQWQDPRTGTDPAVPAPATPRRTAIHAFATDSAAAPRYLASGSVPGYLLGQFAMDAHHGDLRVASTTEPVFAAPAEGAAPDSDTRSAPRRSSDASGDSTATTGAGQGASLVTVLRVDGRQLRPVGTVGGLGPGEQIRAVRFIGDLGYVVTFRQTDPLYAVDLRDPVHPRVAGELKVLGYSAYLHPLGDGLLLGVGRDADATGRVGGLQLSLFDVADPATPERVGQVPLPRAWSAVEGDHHAFTLADGLVLIPFRGGLATVGPTADGLRRVRGDAGVVAVRLSGDRLGAPTVLRAHPGGGGAATGSTATTALPLRTYVDSGNIWTLTTAGVAVHDAATLRLRSFTAF